MKPRLLNEMLDDLRSKCEDIEDAVADLMGYDTRNVQCFYEGTLHLLIFNTVLSVREIDAITGYLQNTFKTEHGFSSVHFRGPHGSGMFNRFAFDDLRPKAFDYSRFPVLTQYAKRPNGKYRKITGRYLGLAGHFGALGTCTEYYKCRNLFVAVKSTRTNKEGLDFKKEVRIINYEELPTDIRAKIEAC